MKKKIIVIILLCTIFIGTKEVKALSNNNIYFTSTNGVSLTEKEYNLFVELYGEEYTNALNISQYNLVNDKLNINNSEIETNITTEELPEIPVSPFSTANKTRNTFYETSYKRLAISKGCVSGSCNIVMALTWLKQPTIRSYDVMGVRYTGSVNIYGIVATTAEFGTSTIQCGSYIFKNNGFGCSIKLSETATHIYITQVFTATGTGRIYGSYQHATTNITKAISQQYNINNYGLGNVFNFYGAAASSFDEMNGVYINVEN